MASTLPHLPPRPAAPVLVPALLRRAALRTPSSGREVGLEQCPFLTLQLESWGAVCREDPGRGLGLGPRGRMAIHPRD